MVDASTVEKPLELRAPIKERIEAVEEDGNTELIRDVEQFLRESQIPPHKDFLKAAESMNLSKTASVLHEVAAKVGALKSIHKSETGSINNGVDTEVTSSTPRSVAYYLQRRVFRSSFGHKSTADTTIEASQESNNTLQQNSAEPKAHVSVVDQETDISSEDSKGLKEKLLGRRPEWLENAKTKLQKGAALLAWRGVSANQTESDLDDLGNLVTEQVAEEAKAESGQLSSEAMMQTTEKQVLGPSVDIPKDNTTVIQPLESAQTVQNQPTIEVSAPPAQSGDIASLQEELDKMENKATSSVDLTSHEGHATEKPTDTSLGITTGESTSKALAAGAQPAVSNTEAPAETTTTPSPDSTPSSSPVRETGEPKGHGLGGILRSIFSGRTD